MKKNLQLKDIDPMIFVGAKDENIKLIENNFKSKIVLRGNKLFLDGDKNELLIIESLVNDIIFTINQKGYIDSSDISILIKSSTNLEKNGVHNNKKLENIILYTHKGSVIPKTEGQKKMI